MINYFYGTAANPFTKGHESIIRYFLAYRNTHVYIGITDHDYKKFEYPFELRKKIVEKNLENVIDRITILRQDKRTFRFLSEIPYKIDSIVVGEDEWRDLNEGKWHHSADLLKNWNWSVIPRTDMISSTKARELLSKDAGYDELDGVISRQTYDILKK